MTFTRRDALLGGAALLAGTALPGSRLAQAAAAGKSRNLLIVLAAGGWDVTYALDPKPDAPAIDGAPGTIRRFGESPILVDAERPAVTAYFERWGPLTAVVNGIGVRSIAHLTCRRRILTGGGDLGAPDLGAIAAHELGRDLPVPYLVLGSTAFAGPLAASTGRVGTTNQILALLDPEQDYVPADGLGKGFAPDALDEQLIRKLLDARAERTRAIRGQSASNAARIRDFQDSLERSDQLRAKSAQFGARGLTLGLSDQARLAADAVGDGLARAVMIDTRLPWDTHTGNTLQGVLHDMLFTDLSGLMAALEARPGVKAGSSLLDETTVVVLSEMSRTPRLNLTAGKDHWPYTSALVMGAGVHGGRTVGGTDDTLASRPIDLVTGATGKGLQMQAQNLLAGVLAIVGIDPELAFPGTEPLRAIAA